MEVITKSAIETRRVGELLAKEVTEGLVIALEGDLGSGKTNFVKGFAKGLGIKEKIISPTFVIMRRYAIPLENLKQKGLKNFYHIDCYRMNSSRDLKDADIESVINNPDNIVAVEWAQNIQNIIPNYALSVKLDYEDFTKRKIVVTKFNNPPVKNN